MMNSSLAAQRELASTLTEVHQNLAVIALQEIGADVATWPEAMLRRDEMQKLINRHRSEIYSGDIDDYRYHELNEWGMDTVLYDPADNKPKYEVSILRASAIELVLSSSPRSDVEAYSDQEGSVAVALAYPSFPFKYIHFRFEDKQDQKDGLVVVCPDTPAVAIHGDDIRYIEESDPTATPYYIHGPQVISAVEKAFGKEAVEPLSDETCLALSAAIRAANPELQNHLNGYHAEYIV